MSSFSRKIVLLAAIVFSIGICYKVSSYTYAKIQSNINFTINSSEDALIAIPDMIELKATKLVSVTTTLLDKGDFIKYEEKMNSESDDWIELIAEEEENSYQLKETTQSIELSYNNFYVKNNMDYVIQVSSSSNFGPHSTSDIAMTNFNNISIAPGQSWEVPCNIDISLENQTYDVIITAEWQNGTASIYKTVNITVDTVNEDKVIDLRKPKEDLKSVPSKDEKLDGNTEDSSKKADKDSRDDKVYKDNDDSKDIKPAGDELFIEPITSEDIDLDIPYIDLTDQRKQESNEDDPILNEENENGDLAELFNDSENLGNEDSSN